VTVEEQTSPQSEPGWISRVNAGRRPAVLLVDLADGLVSLAGELAGQLLDVHTADNVADALLRVGRTEPDVVVVGPLSAHLDPVTLVEALRRNEPDLPVVVGIRPQDSELAGRMAALGPAAVVAHPFRCANLVKLVHSLAAGHRDQLPATPPIDLGRLQIDADTPEIWLDGTAVTLPLREYLLRYLAERVNRVVPYAEIGRSVWGNPEAGTNNTVAVHVTRLRRRLGGDRREARWITAVRGIGYRLTVPPLDVEQ
jgi:DNA-binding response OmpR family regulator